MIAKSEVHDHWYKHFDMVGIPRAWITPITWAGLLESYHLSCPECDGAYTYVGGDEKCSRCRGKGYVTSYRTNSNLLQAWDWIVVDEAHRASNRKAKQSLALAAIRKGSPRLRMISGSVYNANIDGLYHQLKIMYPKLWPSYWRFYEDYVDYIQHNKGYCRSCGNQVFHQKEYKEVLGSKNEDKLRAIIEPYFIRREKKGCVCLESAPPCTSCNGSGFVYAEVCIPCGGSGKERPHNHLDGLPDVLDPVVLKVDLDPKQRRAYDSMKARGLAWVGQFEDQFLPSPIVLSQLTRLRQFAGGYCEIDANDHVGMTEPSSKLDALMALLEDTNKPVVVFTMFSQVIDLAVKRFYKAKIPFIRLDGDTHKLHRNDWELFQSGKAKVFIATIETGGESIELTRASTVVFLDRHWTNKKNEQARDRLWRKGQKNAVQPIHIEARGTVDEKEIPDALAWKAESFRRFLGA